MQRRTRGQVAKSAAIVMFSVQFALVFHLLAGGAAPRWPGMALVLAVSLAVSLAFSGRRCSLVRTSLAAAASQVPLHFLFSAAAVPAAFRPAGEAAGITAGHAASHAGHQVSSLVFESAAASGAHAPMWVGHALAAVATVALVQGFDALAAAVASLASAWIVPLLLFFRTLPVPAFKSPAPASRRSVVVRCQTVLSVAPLRGPPTGPFAHPFLHRLPAATV